MNFRLVAPLTQRFRFTQIFPRFQFWLIVASVMLASGCSITPHKINLSLQQALPMQNVAQKRIAVKVEDKRSLSVIGYQRSVNQPHMAIIAEPSLSEQITTALTLALTKQGYDLSTSPEPKPMLTLFVDQFRYNTPDEDWVTEINLVGSFTIEVSSEQGSFRKSFKAERSQQVATAPSQDYNQQWISEFTRGLLKRVLVDQEVQKALQTL